MKVSYQFRPRSAAQACIELEHLAEGAVRAMQAEIEQAVKAYPCCINCGEFVVRNEGCFPAQPQSMQAMLEGLGSSVEPEDVLEALHGSLPPGDVENPHAIVRIRCARDIALRGGGSTLELACYQAAQRRRRGDDPECAVVVTRAEGCDGKPAYGYRAAVLNSAAHYMPEKAGRLDCPVDRLGPGECACLMEER